VINHPLQTQIQRSAVVAGIGGIVRTTSPQQFSI